MTALRPGTSPPPVRMPMRLLTMPTSQDWHVVIIGGPLATRHRRAAQGEKDSDGHHRRSRPRRELSPQAGPPFSIAVVAVAGVATVAVAGVTAATVAVVAA